MDKHANAESTHQVRSLSVWVPKFLVAAMKLDRRDPAHIKFVLSLIAARAFDLRRLERVARAKPRVALVGHTFTGNLLSFFEYSRKVSLPYQVEYFTLDKTEYNSLLQQHKAGIVLCTAIEGCQRLLTSSCLMSSHGPGVMGLLYFLAPHFRFVYVGHGEGFKQAAARDDWFVRNKYDRIFVASEHQKKRFSETKGYRRDQLRVTGYARIDDLANADNKAKLIRKELGFSPTEPLVLYAPTWRSMGDEGEIPFGASKEEFLGLCNALAEQIGGRLIFRLHMNSRHKVDVSGYNSLVSLDQRNFPNTNDLLCAVDVLVTDWSSIAVDFYALERPVIFLDVPPPTSHPNLSDLNRAGRLVRQFSDLAGSVEDALATRDSVHQEQAEALRKSFGTTVDGQSGYRYDQELRRLLEH